MTPSQHLIPGPAACLVGAHDGTQHWSYCGRGIVILEKQSGAWMGFWSEPKKRNHLEFVFGIDPQGALDLARQGVDLRELGEKWFDAFCSIAHVIDCYTEDEDERGPVTREAITQEAEVLFPEMRQGRCKAYVDGFESLTPQERVHLIDHLVAIHSKVYEPCEHEADAGYAEYDVLPPEAREGDGKWGLH